MYVVCIYTFPTPRVQDITCFDSKLKAPAKTLRPWGKKSQHRLLVCQTPLYHDARMQNDNHLISPANPTPTPPNSAEPPILPVAHVVSTQTHHRLRCTGSMHRGKPQHPHPLRVYRYTRREGVWEFRSHLGRVIVSLMLMAAKCRVVCHVDLTKKIYVLSVYRVTYGRRQAGMEWRVQRSWYLAWERDYMWLSPGMHYRHLLVMGILYWARVAGWGLCRSPVAPRLSSPC